MENRFLEAEGISAHYGAHKAVDKITLSIKKGESYTVIGRSGSGKTTLLHLLSGLRKPDEGTISYDGVPLNGVRPDVGIVLQKNGLFPWKTVRENLSMGVEKNTENIDSRISQIAEELEIEGLLGRYPTELSEGQRQRVAIGRGILRKPSILVMDEPTSALDAITKESIQQMILGLYKSREVTMITVTHDIEEALFLGNHVLVMKDGKLVHREENELFGKEKIRNQLSFYERCIHLREVLDK